LVVEAIDVSGEEMLVFSWEDNETRPPPPESLSIAEKDVLERLVRGDSNATIARARKTSVRTVANQVASLLRKTKAQSRYELIQRYAGVTRG
jgi:DNA-binding CsgD family transcriptional regulator